METAGEREARITRLEAARNERRGQGTIWPTPDDAGTGVIPIQIGPGRGDLRYSSGFVPTFPTALGMIGNRAVSFARIFQSQPWVAAAVMRMLTWAIRVPLKCYQKGGDDPNNRERLRGGDHPIAKMLETPWVGGTSAQLVMNLLGPILVHGNSVTVINDSNRSGDITLTPKDWRYTRPIMPWRAALEGFIFDVDTPIFQSEASIDKVLHLAWWSPIGPLGTSPLMQLGTSLQIEDAAQRYQRSVFVNGGKPPSAVTMSDAFLGMKPEERRMIVAQVRQDMQDIYGGPENMGKPALLPPGLDWKPIGGSVVEAALIEQRKLTREEVAAVYLIPPPLMGILDRATYANIGVQREMTYTDCLGPPLILIEQSINAQIIRDLLQEDNVFVEFDFGGVLRGDRLAEIDALRDAIATALISPNEGRAVLNLPKVDIEAMDEYWMPTNNLSPMSLAAEGAAAPAQPETAAPGTGGEPGQFEQSPDQTPEAPQKGELIVVEGGRQYHLTPA